MRQEIPFVGSSYSNRSSNVNSQRTVNLWPRTQKQGAKSPVTLEGTPGLSLLGVIGTGPWRSNAVEFSGSIYAVSGNELIKITGSYSATSVGTLLTSGGRVEMAAGRNYLMVVDGTYGYTYNGTTFAQIADADFPASPSHCAYLDGWFITNEGGSDQFWKSALEDPTSWSALDFATAEAAPDNVLSLAATFKDLYLIGSTTTQVYYDSGNPSFPLTPYQGGTIDIGIQARYSLAKGPEGLFFLARTSQGDVSVVRMVGTQFSVISDDIAWALSQMTSTDDAYAFLRRVNGRAIYQITFPSEDATYDYIVEEDKWVERKSYGYGRYMIAGHGFINGAHMMFDAESGNYYKEDFSVCTDNGQPIERIRRAPVIHQTNNKLMFREIVVEFEAGIGIATGQGSDPQAMLRYSDDGGHKWSNEIWASMGKIGEYGRRARWKKLGMSRQRVCEVTITDPVKVVMIAAYANVELCDN